MDSSESLQKFRSTWNNLEKTWMIPLNRMKSSREDRVPLNDEYMEILTKLDQLKLPSSSLVFTHQLSDVAISKALKAVSYSTATIHGLRSSFRDWRSDNINFSREVCEAALAHAIQNQTEAAYRRSDLFGKRHDFMRQWGK